jgi:hypothetical protein
MWRGSSSHTPSKPESRCRGCRERSGSHCLQATFDPWRRTDPRMMKATVMGASTMRSTSSPSTRGGTQKTGTDGDDSSDDGDWWQR